MQKGDTEGEDEYVKTEIIAKLAYAKRLHSYPELKETTVEDSEGA